MKRVLSMALCAAAAVALVTGCEWSSSSDKNEHWNDSYNWVNFSGTYRSLSGGMLVTDYTSTPLTPGSTNYYTATESGGTLPSGVTTGSGTTRNKPITPGSFSLLIGEVLLSDDGTGVLSGNGGSGSVNYSGGTWSFKVDSGASSETVSTTETGGTLPAGETSANGTTKNKRIVPGSFTLTVGDVTLSDDGTGKLSGEGGSGSVNYEGGVWSIQLAVTMWNPNPRGITLSYAYTKSVASGARDIVVKYAYGISKNGSGGGGAQPGSTGKAIYSFVVSQQGQNLSITDNNGAKYTGRIKTLRSSSGVAATNSLPRDGDTIIASFSTEGTSAANMRVTIAGTFQGTVAASVFTGRTMQGTWIEAGGKTGDINGTTDAVSISTASSDTGTTTVE